MEIYFFISLGLILAVGCLWYLTPKCNHRWEVVSETITKSKGERYGEMTGRVLVASNSFQLDQLTEQKHIQVIKCTSCAKLKRFVETI